MQYERHKWHICRYLKVIVVLLGLQLGYTKNMFFFYVRGTVELIDNTTELWNSLLVRISIQENLCVACSSGRCSKSLSSSLHNAWVG